MKWDPGLQWILQRVVDHRTRVVILLSEAPTAQDLLVVRSLVPQLAAMSPAATQDAVGRGGRFEVGDLPREEAVRFVAEAASRGLKTQTSDATRTGYIPLTVTSEGESALIIEKDTEAESVVREMLAAGVPVRDEAPAGVTLEVKVRAAEQWDEGSVPGNVGMASGGRSRRGSG